MLSRTIKNLILSCLIINCLSANVWAFGEKLELDILQNDWPWLDIGSSDINGLNINLFTAEVNQSVTKVVQALFSTNDKVFNKLQIVENVYLVSGSFFDKHYLAQVFALESSKTKVYLSGINSIKQKLEFEFNHYLPSGIEIISQISDLSMIAKGGLLIFKTNLNFGDLLQFVNRHLVADGWYPITEFEQNQIEFTWRNQTKSLLSLYRLEINQNPSFLFWYQEGTL